MITTTNGYIKTSHESFYETLQESIRVLRSHSLYPYSFDITSKHIIRPMSELFGSLVRIEHKLEDRGL